MNTQAPAHIAIKRPRDTVSRDCGPEGCQIDWLSSRREEVELDVMEFTKRSMELGWGDGLPLIPPTEGRVRGFLAANNYFPDQVVALLPPMRSECTIEKIAINAVMAGAPPESLPLLVAAVEAIASPNFELAGLNATTASVVPLLLVNGPIRDKLDIPYKHGCLGGAASTVTAIGRALRLIIRNVAGQIIGVTSQSTFGSPGRVAGIVFGEWEERSPWAPLAERRGVKGNAVTAYGTNGTMNIIDTTSQKGPEFLEMIGKSMAYHGANGFSPAVPFAEILVAVNPIWADIIHRDVPKLEDVQELLWKHASLPASALVHQHREQLEKLGRIHPNGRTYLATAPKDVLLVTCGGTGSLHAAAFHSWGTCITTTAAID
ncbi:MAG: hypothetical protein K2P94_13245 [Rhodospirillaceae bacterium]|nr:hypothetical protein [Rhodospirillaceae bacterium]